MIEFHVRRKGRAHVLFEHGQDCGWAPLADRIFRDGVTDASRERLARGHRKTNGEGQRGVSSAKGAQSQSCVGARLFQGGVRREPGFQ